MSYYNKCLNSDLHLDTIEKNICQECYSWVDLDSDIVMLSMIRNCLTVISNSAYEGTAKPEAIGDSIHIVNLQLGNMIKILSKRANVWRNQAKNNIQTKN